MFNVFLILHIAGGTIGLLAGTLNIIRKKSGKFHNVTGNIFTISMLITGASSLVLASIHSSFFLFIVGVFTLYLAATGKRYVNLRLLASTQKASVIDWTITIGMLAAAFVFIVFGIKLLLASENFGIVLIVFGVLGLRFVRVDFANYKGNVTAKNYWLLEHLKRMTGCHIAAATAFLVVNVKYFPFAIPPVVAWLLPTVILTPLIIKWVKEKKIA